MSYTVSKILYSSVFLLLVLSTQTSYVMSLVQVMGPFWPGSPYKMFHY